MAEEKLPESLFKVISRYPFLSCGFVLLLLGAAGALPLGTSAQSRLLPIPGWARWSLFIVGLASIVFEAVRQSQVTTAPTPLGSVSGSIDEPAGRAIVTSAFSASGSAKQVQPGHHLWLISEVGTYKWPKGSELALDKEGNWHSRVFEDGTGELFSLSLYVADREGSERIHKWLDIGALIGYHPFVVEIPGTRRLARIDGLRKQGLVG
jgi:hypothetical protein